jgi:hypothetical protein
LAKGVLAPNSTADAIASGAAVQTAAGRDTVHLKERQQVYPILTTPVQRAEAAPSAGPQRQDKGIGLGLLFHGAFGRRPTVIWPSRLTPHS